MRTIEIEVAFELGQRVEFDNKIGKDEGVVTGYSIRMCAITSTVQPLPKALAALL